MALTFREGVERLVDYADKFKEGYLDPNFPKQVLDYALPGAEHRLFNYTRELREAVHQFRKQTVAYLDKVLMADKALYAARTGRIAEFLQEHPEERSLVHDSSDAADFYENLKRVVSSYGEKVRDSKYRIN